MKKLLAIVEITRPVNLIITFLVVIISAFICGGSDENIGIFLVAGLSASFVAASGNIINDILDIQIDRINRPERVLPSGRLNKNSAIILNVVLIFGAIFLSYSISFSAVSMVIISSILLLLYSIIFKRIPLIGNIVVSICTALAFIYGGIVAGNLSASIIPAIFAFQINLIREIVKDIEDFEGDSLNKINTVMVKYGFQISKKILYYLFSLLILTTFYPFLTHFYKIEYFIIVLFFVDLPLIILLKEFYYKKVDDSLSKISFSLKIIMIMGLIAISAGSF